MDLRVGKNYQLIKKIGSGAFGEIYEGTNLFTFLIRHARQTRHNEGNGRYQACKN
jgi:serine/threonine protein kinase